MRTDGDETKRHFLKKVQDFGDQLDLTGQRLSMSPKWIEIPNLGSSDVINRKGSHKIEPSSFLKHFPHSP